MMATLYKRATPSQHRMLRAIAGAVKNAADAHSVPLPNSFARSVAKRATGTLTAQWPDVLAARSALSPSGGENCLDQRRQSAAPLTARADRRAPHFSRRSPLPYLWRRLSAHITPLRSAGQHDQAEMLIEVLKIVAEIQRDPSCINRRFSLMDTLSGPSPDIKSAE